MSRNKDVKVVHEITGLPYSECRRRLKESDWNVWEAAKIVDASLLSDFADAICRERILRRMGKGCRKSRQNDAGGRR